MNRIEVRDSQGVGLAEIFVGGNMITIRKAGIDWHWTPETVARYRDALDEALLLVGYAGSDPDPERVACSLCGKWTTRAEANARLVRTGCCGHCGGALSAIPMRGKAPILCPSCGRGENESLHEGCCWHRLRCPDCGCSVMVPYGETVRDRAEIAMSRTELRTMQRRAAAGRLPIPMLCPKCGKGEPRILKKDVERGDLNTVTCPFCGCRTDMYEAQKMAAEKR